MPEAQDLKHIENVRNNNGIYIVPFVLIMLAIWTGAVFYWLSHGEPFGFLLLVYIGFVVGMGIGGYVAVPDRFRPFARKTTMFYVGVLLLVLAVTTDHGNMQIEGFFFAIVSGLAPFVIIHYFLAKIAGPLMFGRLWCGWACWYGMVFDLLPYPFSFYRRDRRLSSIRFIHLGLSIALVAALWFLADFDGATGNAGLRWFLVGLGLYYVSGIVIGLGLKDNRAFCKYVCPISVPMKLASRFSLLKISGTTELCEPTCEMCIEMCPMNIRVKDYLDNHTRVLSTECVMCLTCVSVCPKKTVKLSLGFDIGGTEFWDHDPTKGNRQTVPSITWTRDDSDDERAAASAESHPHGRSKP